MGKGEGVPGLAMSRSLGDTKVHAVGVLSEPSIQTSIEFTFGNILVLASDGLWEKINSEGVVAAALHAHGDSEAAALGLAVEARSRWLREGGDVDDITVLVVHATPDNDGDSSVFS